ncbi:MAG: hypothetical protein SOY83_04925 [Anaerovoracaceae bacterium]|nr:rubrerythrin [Bacillota bacterium]MDY3954806.1 hypothetical protein [Anaerovoracaceae bacterium]
MDKNNSITITTRDRALLAWENSMELVRSFENFGKEISDNDRAAKAFRKFAEEEAQHAAEFLEILHSYEKN